MQFSLAKSSAFVAATFGVCTSAIAQKHNIEHVDVIGQRLATAISLDTIGEVSASPDLSDIIVRLPGINTNGNGPLTSIVQYRGLFGNRIRVNIDGAPTIGAGPNAMDPPLSNVFATSGTQITLYRGIAPVTAGAETIGGAISVDRDVSVLFTANPTWQAGLQSQLLNQGSTNHKQATFSYHDSDFFFSGFGADQQRGDADDGEGREIPNSFYERDAYGFSMGFRMYNHQVTSHYQVIGTDDTGTAALAMDIKYIDSESYRLHYLWQRDDNSSLSLRLSGNNNQHGMNNFDHRPMTMPMMSRLNTVDSFARGYEAIWQQGLAAGELTVGLDWHTARHNSVITNPIMENLTIRNFNEVERTNQSAYVQWQRDYDRLNVSAGLRHTLVDTSAGDVANTMAMMNPNIAALQDTFNSHDRDLDFDFTDVTLHLNYEMSPNWRWHFAAGQKSRAPSYTELYVWLPLGISAGLADGRNYLGNLNLKHETARQLDLGVTFEQNGTSFSPRVFYQDFDDYIVGNPSENMAANMVSTMMSGQPPLQWGNVDATLYGLDLLLTHQLSKTMQLSMNGVLVKGDRDDIDESLYRIAPATLQTQIKWDLQNWGASLEWQLVASQSDVSGIQNEMESAGYGIINANLRYQINDHIELTVLLNNLFDKAYQNHLGGINRVAGVDQPVGERLFAPGRTFGIGFNFRN